MNDFQSWLKFFEKVGCLYRKIYSEPLWNKYSHHSWDVWDSLAIFLEGYAFERQGRSPDYCYAAADALNTCKRGTNANLTPEMAKCVWETFQEYLGGKNLNHQNNPLCPKGTPHCQGQGAEKKELKTKKRSVMEVDFISRDCTLSVFFKSEIKENRIKEAHEKIKSIQGIRDKVASFYLRDLADINISEIEWRNIKERHLLQPIDIWVERIVERICPRLKSVREKKEVAQEWIVKKSLDLNLSPERVNMGIWFFGAKIVTSEYRLEKKLKNLKDAEKILDNFIKRLKGACSQYDAFQRRP